MPHLDSVCPQAVPHSTPRSVGHLIIDISKREEAKGLTSICVLCRTRTHSGTQSPFMQLVLHDF